MNKFILLFVAGVVVVLIGWSLVQIMPQQTPGEKLQSGIVQVSGGSYRNIASEQLWTMLQKKDFVLINVHIPYEGELPQTDMFIPYNEIDKNLDKLPLDKSARIVLYCRSGRMSAIAAETMVKLGYTDVWNLKEGMREWEQKGYTLLNKP
ncbi:Thiosulfate sulfurtransferase GlpE [uncultured archaeon]|nr:Thiosulfate sulfurtransferase GlpE [uncultured archaeon]